MQDLSKPQVILTHESDLDGLVSGLLLQRLAERLFNDSPRLEAWNYNGWRAREMSESAAWVCDLSFEARLDSSIVKVRKPRPRIVQITTAAMRRSVAMPS